MTDGSRSPVRRWLPYLPPALLCLMAIQQVYLSRTKDLTPWKGGGFGMFSTNDGPNRRLWIWIEGPEGERQLEPLNTDLQVSRSAAFPTEERLQAFAKKIGTFQRSQGVELSRVRIIVWRRDFDPESMEPRFELIRETVVEFPPSPSSP